MWEKKHRIKESQIEVDNGVHPLHWATSSGPSPMGTDPINLFKMVQKMVLESTSATVNRMLYKVFKTSLLEITISLQKEKKDKIITENVDFHNNSMWTLHSKTLGASFSYLCKLLITEKRCSVL